MSSATGRTETAGLSGSRDNATAAGPELRPPTIRVVVLAGLATALAIAVLGPGPAAASAGAFSDDLTTTLATPALLTPSSVLAWGSNGNGELGDDTNSGPEQCANSEACSTIPMPVGGLSEVADVSTGGINSFALLSNGTVMAWGSNDNGALGNGAETDSDVPIPVRGLSGVAAVAAGEESNLALLNDGTVVAWGENEAGQLGDGTNAGPETCFNEIPCSKVPVPVSDLSGVTAIAAGSGRSLALLSNGTVMAWGENVGDGTTTNSDVPTPVSGLAGVTAIAAGERGSLALLGNGTVMAWGSNLGNGTSGHSNVPVPVSGLGGVTAIAAGDQHSLALLRDGTVMAWGANSHGQLGSGTVTSSNVPQPVIGLSDVAAIAAGYRQSLALLGNGTVMAWGANRSGQLGDGTSDGPEECPGEEPCSTTPVPVSGLSGITDIAGHFGGLALHALRAPSVTDVQPNTGGATGGTSVRITGTNFTGATAVKFGRASATGVRVRSANSIAAISPPGAGTVDVTVILGTVASAVSVADHFSYGPTVTAVNPGSGSRAGGRTVSITGTNLGGATDVKFGSEDATKFMQRSATRITAVSPAGAGTVDVTVTTPGGTSPREPADRFTYETTITGLSPALGSPAGGTTVGVTGTNLAGATAVRFGSENATRFTVHSANFITAVAPPAGPGTVYVSVTTPEATTAIGADDQFTYAVPGEWRIFPSLSPGSTFDWLSNVSCLSERRCMAVGALNSGRTEALAESWNGRAWSIAPTPVVSNSASSLRGVSCVSATFCAAVGKHTPAAAFAEGPKLPLTEIWDGNKWAVIPNASIENDDSLLGVSCVSSRFCVAVGSFAYNEGAPGTLVESWHGSAWTIAMSPSPGIFDELDGVSCVSVRFCVAVGFEVGPEASLRPLVESWNGTEWSVVPSPGGGLLDGVSCLSNKRCMAVGGSADGDPLTESWNGSTWSVLESQDPEGGGSSELRGVSCVSGRACAAVGYHSTATEEGPYKTLVETSKGAKWSIVPSANSASGQTYLEGVSCVSAGSCLAVGEDEATLGEASRTLVESGGVQSPRGSSFSRLH
jgi:alpha-tubulin suppressor-like RCC1 family protein